MAAENVDDVIPLRFMSFRLTQTTDEAKTQTCSVAEKLRFIVRLEREKPTCDYLPMSLFPVSTQNDLFRHVESTQQKQ